AHLDCVRALAVPVLYFAGTDRSRGAQREAPPAFALAVERQHHAPEKPGDVFPSGKDGAHGNDLTSAALQRGPGDAGATKRSSTSAGSHAVASNPGASLMAQRRYEQPMRFGAERRRRRRSRMIARSASGSGEP